MRRRYDHIDLRVRSLAEARPFYETLMPRWGSHAMSGSSIGSSSERTVRLNFLASRSRRGMSPTNAEKNNWGVGSPA